MITIAHLYHDLLNLYGENGNIKVLKRELEKQGVEVSVKKLSILDELHFDDYNFIYMGAGTEGNQKIALKHLIQYKEDIKRAFDANTFFLITGNSLEMFGQNITDLNNTVHEAIGLFPYTAKEVDFRIADEVYFGSRITKLPILGFQNQNSIIQDNTDPMFAVIKGVGSYPNSKGEGIFKNHFYGTYVIGPILVRNPYLLDYLIHEITYTINKNFQFNSLALELEKNAYHAFVKNNYSGK